MKKYLLILLSSIIIPLGVNAMNMNNDKDITKLWTQYDRAEEADKPKDQLKILDEIKTQAAAHRLTADFYRAVTLYREVTVNTNWKLADKAKARMEKEIRDYDEPVLTFQLFHSYSDADKTVEFIKRESGRLKAASNPDIWNKTLPSSSNVDLIRGTLTCDYDYVLWAFFMKNYTRNLSGHSAAFGFVKNELETVVKGKYPQEPLFEFMMIDTLKDGRKEAWEAFARKYKGRAVSLWAEQCLLRAEFNAFDEDETTSSQYRDFYRKLESFESERARYKGEEAKIAAGCRAVEYLMSSMNEKEARVELHEGRVEMYLRNLTDCDFNLYRSGADNELVFRRKLNEGAGSFYAWDTIEFELPVLDDGEYRAEIKKGKKSYANASFPKYTISLAYRNKSVYVADYKSGKPFEKVDLHLVSGEDETDVLKDFAIDGFTALPESWIEALRSSRKYRLYASCVAADGIMRQSSGMGYFGSMSTVSDWDGYSNVLILKDCSAFNPGQTVKFKVIGYNVASSGKMSVVPEGTVMNAELVSPKNEVLKTIELTADEYGSANGEFVLENLPVHGWHKIVIRGKDGLHGSTELLVDEYVLPAFSLVFDRNDNLYLPGDAVEVSGVVKAYSGHVLSGAKITYTVNINGRKSEEKSLLLSENGSFELSYETDFSTQYQNCVLTVKVVDATGETLEFTDYKRVSANFNLYVNVKNALDAELLMAGVYGGQNYLVDGNAELVFELNGLERKFPEVRVDYRLLKGSESVLCGRSYAGESVVLSMDGLQDGHYVLEATAVAKDNSGREYKSVVTANIIRISPGASAVDADFNSYFRALEGLAVQMSPGKREAWVVAELFDEKGVSLKMETVHIPADLNGRAALYTFSYDFEDFYTDAVVLKLFYFADSASRQFSHVFRRPQETQEMNVGFSRFTDTCLPSSRYSISFESDPSAEFTATVFDRATETFASNLWYKIQRQTSPVADYYVSTDCGRYGYRNFRIRGRGAYSEETIPFACVKSAPMFVAEDVLSENEAMTYDTRAVSKMSVSGDAAVEETGTSDVAVRENFATSLAFKPHLRAGKDGNFSFDFTTSDKLSTFVCALYGHDKEMNTVTERKEFVVTMPVKVSAVQPQFLYEGDSYVFKAAVTNSGKPVKGVFTIYMYKGDSDEVSQTAHAEVELGENATEQLSLPVSGVPAGLGSLSFKAVFEGAVGNENFSDAIRVSVPVLPAKQILTESHSAVLLNETERETLMDSLRSAFVNTTAAGAGYSEASLDDLLRAELKVTPAPEYQNVLSLMDALYCNALGGALVTDNAGYKAAASKMETLLGEYVNSDGGFAWMKGMKSSVVISSCIAERIAFLRDRGLASDNLLAWAKNTVRYIDRNQFEYRELPYWCGYLSDWQYMLVRSLWTEVPFDRNIVSGKVQKENFEKFADWASDLLVGKKRNGINGNLGAKYTRMYMLLSLLTNENGRDLAKTWGVKSGSESKLLKALAADVQSLNQYAVEHRSGAWYLPDLVMPYRGVLMSEAFHHANVANLYYALANVRDEAMSKKIAKAVGAGDMAMAAEIADGIRLWIMIQKESQEWRADAEFYTAIASVYDGSEALKEVKIISLSKKYEKPFEEIKAAGNGFGIEVKYYLDEVEPENEIKAGQVLKLGDKVVAQYNIWNEENRSFVRLSVPRPACLRPEEQVSGYPRWSFYRIGCLGFWFTPMAYREVRARYTDYWFDVLPEEKTVYTENFYVTQAGVFTLPVASVESLYAPHYRANDAFRSRFVTE
ncbi:MAG: hypothetical protein ACI3ZQ_11765 [Candidatus Cryptobacteroides sp.]